MNKTRTYIELIESIPESLYPYLLGLQPFNNELQLSKILFDFIKNIQKVQLIKQPFDFTPQLLKIGITKKNAETLLSHDAQAIKSYFAHLDPLWMIAAALPIIDAEYSLRPTSFYFQLKKDFIEQLRKHDLLTFDYPLSKELLTLLYPYLPYEKRLDLLAGQLNAFEKQSLLFQKIERTEERIIKQSNLYAALESQKELLLSIQNASWWEKLLYWLKQLFHDKKTAQPCHKIQLLQAQQLQWLTQSTLQFIQHYASIESVNLLGTTLPWAVLKKDAFLKSLLREYKPTLEVLQNHPADIRRTLDLCAILCEKSVHEQDIFIQHILIHKEDQQVCYKNYPLMLQTLNESALNFYDLLIKECVEQDVIRLDDIIITDTQYPLLAKTLKTPESLGLYLKLQFLLDNNHSFQSIELGLTDELIERMIIERSYLKLSLDHHSQRTNHFVQILGKSSSLHFDEDFQKFYDRFSIENKLLFLETYIATHQQSDIKEFDAAIESLNLDVEQWNQLCSITSLSFSMTQYLLEKVILDFKNTANEMTIIEPLLRKMYHHLITTECSPVFFNYLSRLTMIYSEAKLLLFKKTSLLPELYKSFEETTFSTNKDFLLEQIAIELSLKEKQEYSTRDKLFFALTAMKANDALDKKFLSTFVGLFLTQSQAMQQALCSWLMDFLKGMACRAPIEFLEKQPLLLQIFAGFNMEDRKNSAFKFNH
jgi:hypothetical protein